MNLSLRKLTAQTCDAGLDVESSALAERGRTLAALESRPWLQAVIIVLAAGVLSLPCLTHGLPNGTTARTHIGYQRHFSQQFWDGDIYPRWLAESNKGYGSPIFLIQYPLPYFATALLRAVTSFAPADRESRELGVFMFLVMAASGVSAWIWLRKLAGPLAATLAALIYMSLPYVLDQGLYGRAAIGELCAFVWMPLAFSLCDSKNKNFASTCLLGGVLSLLFVSNLLSAILFAPALVIYAIASGEQRTRLSAFKTTLFVVLAEALGAGIAGVYLVPMFAYRRLFDLHQLDANLPGYRFGLYFLQVPSRVLATPVMALTASAAVVLAVIAAWRLWRVPGGKRLRLGVVTSLFLGALALVPNLGLSVARRGGFDVPLAYATDFSAAMLIVMFSTLSLGVLAYSLIARSARPREFALLSSASVAFFLMLPFSAFVWKAVPGSEIIQFPFRLGGILTIAVLEVVAVAIDSCTRETPISRRRPSFVILSLAVLAVIAGGICTWRTDRAFRKPAPVSFNLTQDMDPMYRTYVSPQSLPGFAMAMGTNAGSYVARPMPGDGTLRVGTAPGCEFTVRRETSRRLGVSSQCTGEALLPIGQLYSPLWKISSFYGSTQRPVLSASSDGLLELKVGPGKEDIKLEFDGGAPEQWGKIVSLSSLLVAFAGLFIPHRTCASI